MAVAGGGIYCMDTSSLLHAWQRAYPPKRFPKLWAELDSLIYDGRLIASIEVYLEIQKRDDEVFEWAKARKETMFREFDEEQQTALVAIMSAYPRLVDTRTGKSGADPFVIALASCPPKATVVTQEAFGVAASPRIPFVCAQEGVDCTDLLGMFEAEDWVF